MIVDSSVIVALLLREPGHDHLLGRLAASTGVAVGGPTLAEAGVVLAARLGPSGKTLLTRFVQEAELAVVPFTDDHWPLAVDAYLRFGKGRHPAALNLGACLTYAICRAADRPLLCVGDAFARTDLVLAE